MRWHSANSIDWPNENAPHARYSRLSLSRYRPSSSSWPNAGPPRLGEVRVCLVGRTSPSSTSYLSFRRKVYPGWLDCSHTLADLGAGGVGGAIQILREQGTAPVGWGCARHKVVLPPRSEARSASLRLAE